MIDQSAIAQGDALRAEIAAKMAAFEVENGPVQTSPILTDDKRVPFRLSCPEKKQQRLSDNQTKERSRSKINDERQQVHARNLDRIRALANCKLNTKAIAERTGLSISTVGKILKEIRDGK